MNFYKNIELYGDEILVIDNNSKYKVRYKPTLYIKSDFPTEYTTIHNEYLARKDFDSISSAKEYIKFQKNRGIPVYGQDNFISAYISENWPGKIEYNIERITIGYIDIETEVSSTFPDPEKAEQKITAISLIYDEHKCFSVGLGKYNVELDQNEYAKELKIHYIQAENEKKLLTIFLSEWQKIKLDIITGWNIDAFDMSYIVNRMNKVLGKKFTNRLSIWNLPIKDKTVRQAYGKTTTAKIIRGITNLDYLHLYKKFMIPVKGQQESYSLNYISYDELGEKKLDYDEYDKLDDLRIKNHQKYIEYNIKDAWLVKKINDKLGLISQGIAVAYSSKGNYISCLTSVQMWDNLIYNECIERGKVIPPHDFTKSDSRVIAGGYVKEPIAGMHEWAVSYDLASLYPNLMIQYNISPEMFISRTYNDSSAADVESVVSNSDSLKELKDDPSTICAGGARFASDSPGIIPSIIDKLYSDRVSLKKRLAEAKGSGESSDMKDYLHAAQLAKKIQMNSCFGVLNNQYCRWSDPVLAEAITLTGQSVIKRVANKVNGLFNSVLATKDDYIIAIDTDSIIISFEKLIRDKAGIDISNKEKCIAFIKQFCDRVLEKFIADQLAVFAKDTNAFKQSLTMKREIIADRAVWVSKKRYMLAVCDNEGRREDLENIKEDKLPPIKIMGIETKRSSTSEVCREALTKAIEIIMFGRKESKLIDYVGEFKRKFYKMPFSDVAFPRSVQNLKKYKAKDSSIYKKATPIAVKASLIYNDVLDKKNLQALSRIGEGEKIKFVYLNKPNPMGQEVIGAPEYLPPELGLDKYINYDLQFEKSFIQPLKKICDAIGWKYEKVKSLEDLF